MEEQNNYIYTLRSIVSRLRWSFKNKLLALKFLLSSSRISWQREWEACSSAEDLFNFASSHIGLGQNRDEFLRFLAHIEGTKPVNVMEIGVRDGGTNFMFANALHTCRTVVGLDIHLQNIYLLRTFCPDWIRRQVFVCGNSTHLRTINRVRKRLGSAKLDVLFIDGDHSYSGIVADFKAYRKFVRDDGIIAFHDICIDHHRRFGIETPNDSGEVYIFWQKLRRIYETMEFFSDEKQNGAGIGIIIYDSSRSADHV
jgi:cephalosporin hydroxylase